MSGFSQLMKMRFARGPAWVRLGPGAWAGPPARPPRPGPARPPAPRQAPRGHRAVGAVVSEYTHSISSAGTAEGEFCEEFRAPIHEAVARLNESDVVLGQTSQSVSYRPRYDACRNLGVGLEMVTTLALVVYTCIMGIEPPTKS